MKLCTTPTYKSSHYLVEWNASIWACYFTWWWWCSPAWGPERSFRFGYIHQYLPKRPLLRKSHADGGISRSRRLHPSLLHFNTVEVLACCSSRNCRLPPLWCPQVSLPPTTLQSDCERCVTRTGMSWSSQKSPKSLCKSLKRLAKLSKIQASLFLVLDCYQINLSSRTP